MKMKGLDQVWDVESIFPGGSSSKELEAWLAGLSGDIEKLQEAADPDGSTGELMQLIETIQDIAARLRQSAAFVFCLTAQDVKDDRARLLYGRLQQME